MQYLGHSRGMRVRIQINKKLLVCISALDALTFFWIRKKGRKGDKKVDILHLQVDIIENVKFK